MQRGVCRCVCRVRVGVCIGGCASIGVCVCVRSAGLTSTKVPNKSELALRSLNYRVHGRLKVEELRITDTFASNYVTSFHSSPSERQQRVTIIVEAVK